ncbi:hypothetical protein [Cytobacillus oceanisediminis]|nr:hypothetical protein [Cytobacillus oceanisediminis]MBU8773194.1 hypothetical protein [Cytobacillus oceanisediminis]
MFVSKREHEELKKKVEQQESAMREMMGFINDLAKEVSELKKPKESNYFG